MSTAQVPRLSPAWLPGLYAANTTTRSGMTSTSASPDMRFGSPRRASWLGAIHARRAQSQHPGPIPPPTLPPYHPAPSFSDIIPHASPHSASTAAQNVLLLRLRVPYHARNSSCAALAGTQTAGHRAASFRGTRTPGFFASARTIERSPRQREGAFALLRRSPNREWDFA